MSGGSGRYGHIERTFWIWPDNLHVLKDLYSDQDVNKQCRHVGRAIDRVVLDTIHGQNVESTPLFKALRDLVDSFDRQAAGDDGEDTLQKAVDRWNAYADAEFRTSEEVKVTKLEHPHPHLCEHANECPLTCPCPPACYCRTNTCKG
jgi:hypothetical protein